MKASAFLSAYAAACTLVTGCSMYRAGFENLINAPSQFQIQHDRRATERHHRDAAHEALAEWKRSDVNGAATVDYADGFEQGVVDFLTYGGNAPPPVLPPRKYWRLGRRAKTGNLAAEQWLQGAADGRSFAMESGQRDAAVVPASASVRDDTAVTWPVHDESIPVAPDINVPPSAVIDGQSE